MAGKVGASGRPQQHLDRITGRCVPEEAAEHGGAQPLRRQPSQAEALGYVVRSRLALGTV